MSGEGYGSFLLEGMIYVEFFSAHIKEISFKVTHKERTLA